VITGIIVASYISAAVALADQLRRPASAWTAADRDRGWWLSATVILGLAACGLFIGIAYLLGVVPRFASDDGVDPSFRK
jgi:hypothetical protein